MKPFMLSRKYAEWCESSAAEDSNNFLSWFTILIWPIIFHILCVVIFGNLSGASIGGIIASSFVSAVLTFLTFLFSVCALEIEDLKYQLHCFISNWVIIAVVDIATLPFFGVTWFMKEVMNHIGLLADASRRKLRFVSMDDFIKGKFRQDRIQPYLFGKRKPTWNEKTILDIAREIVRDQIGRSFRNEQESDDSFVQETAEISEIQIDTKEKTAQLCFSATHCSRNGSDDKIDVGYYFVTLALDENLNAARVSNLFFDSRYGEKTKREIKKAFELYQANTSMDLCFDYDPLGLNSKEKISEAADFSPELPSGSSGKIPVAE